MSERDRCSIMCQKQMVTKYYFLHFRKLCAVCKISDMIARM